MTKIYNITFCIVWPDGEKTSHIRAFNNANDAYNCLAEQKRALMQLVPTPQRCQKIVCEMDAFDDSSDDDDDASSSEDDNIVEE